MSSFKMISIVFLALSIPFSSGTRKLEESSSTQYHGILTESTENLTTTIQTSKYTTERIVAIVFIEALITLVFLFLYSFYRCFCPDVNKMLTNCTERTRERLCPRTRDYRIVAETYTDLNAVRRENNWLHDILSAHVRSLRNTEEGKVTNLNIANQNNIDPGLYLQSASFQWMNLSTIVEVGDLDEVDQISQQSLDFNKF